MYYQILRTKKSTSELKQTKTINLAALEEKTKVRRRRPQKGQETREITTNSSSSNDKAKSGENVLTHAPNKPGGEEMYENNTATTMSCETVSEQENSRKTISDLLGKLKIPDIARKQKFSSNGENKSEEEETSALVGMRIVSPNSPNKEIHERIETNRSNKFSSSGGENKSEEENASKGQESSELNTNRPSSNDKAKVKGMILLFIIFIIISVDWFI